MFVLPKSFAHVMSPEERAIEDLKCYFTKRSDPRHSGVRPWKTPCPSANPAKRWPATPIDGNPTFQALAFIGSRLGESIGW